MTPELNGKINFYQLETNNIVDHAGLFLLLKLLVIGSVFNSTNVWLYHLKILYLAILVSIKVVKEDSYKLPGITFIQLVLFLIPVIHIQLEQEMLILVLNNVLEQELGRKVNLPNITLSQQLIKLSKKFIQMVQFKLDLWFTQISCLIQVVFMNTQLDN